MSLYTSKFWQDASERAIKTVAQAIISLWLVGDGIFNLLSVDLKQTLGVAAGAGVVSLLTSIVSASVTQTDSASVVVNTVKK